MVRADNSGTQPALKKPLHLRLAGQEGALSSAIYSLSLTATALGNKGDVWAGSVQLDVESLRRVLKALDSLSNDLIDLYLASNEPTLDPHADDLIFDRIPQCYEEWESMKNVLAALNAPSHPVEPLNGIEWAKVGFITGFWRGRECK